ncbi:hypothetical protein GCM10010149_03540 [Nonomuraea roseoviolacea subsp. roseoviolacea]|uniref:hypothetical protein n=1 Tax=Nonomuraea roseoviolacea TaxID=103837 RepID=UPI0031D9F391
MPARSNDFQAVVYFVKRHLAADATVSESAYLRDRITGQMREVDVLITAHVAGHSVQIGIEYRGRSRKDAVSWVEEMRAEHDDLPTDRLVLVSASGFSKAAAAKARHYGIEAVTPGQPIAVDGPPWPGSGIRGWSFAMSPTSGWWPSAAPWRSAGSLAQSSSPLINPLAEAGRLVGHRIARAVPARID